MKEIILRIKQLPEDLQKDVYQYVNERYRKEKTKYGEERNDI